MRWTILLPLTLVACTTEEVPLGETTTDTGVVDSARADAGSDTTTEDSSLDSSPDGSTDSVLDASAVSATIKEEFLFQSCMPIVPTDPVRLKATVAFDNPTAISFGTLRASKGRLLSGSGGVTVATFEFPEIELTLLPMSTVRRTFEKSADSVEPKASCGTLTCGGTVRVEVVFTGPSASITATSGEITVECAY